MTQNAIIQNYNEMLPPKGEILMQISDNTRRI